MCSRLQVVGAGADGGASENVPAKWFSAWPQSSRAVYAAAVLQCHRYKCPALSCSAGWLGDRQPVRLSLAADFAALRARASIVLIRTSVTGTVDSSQTNAHLVPTPLYV